MIRFFRKIARQIRHLPGLEKLDFLWNAVRGPYEVLLALGGQGVIVEIGGRAPVRVPLRYAKGGWENYEKKTIEVFYNWCRLHPGVLVLDVGSSTGIFTAAALVAHHKNEVISFDADASSLSILVDFCRFVSTGRLQVVRGLITSSSTYPTDLKTAVAESKKYLHDPTASNAQAKYVCLNHSSAEGIPKYSLDNLLQDLDLKGRPLMVKVDVEGAELLVLQGARQILRRHRPVLLVEVHPELLPQHSQSPKDLEDFFAGEGYEHQLVAIDYSEHWLCLPKNTDA